MIQQITKILVLKADILSDNALFELYPAIYRAYYKGERKLEKTLDELALGELPIVSFGTARPTLEVSSEYTDGLLVFTSTLKADICTNSTTGGDIHLRKTQLLNPHAKLAYALTLTDGSHLLLGNTEQPFPVQALSSIHPASAGDEQFHRLTVTHKVDFPPFSLYIE